MSDDKAIRAALLTAQNLGGRVWHRAEGGPVDNPEEGFTAYHGSPHDFDRFDMSKIGTGEGAQAYGHGLYFAGNEGVAKGYRDTLAQQAHDKATTVDNHILMNGKKVDSSHPDFSLISGIADSGFEAEMNAAKDRLEQRKAKGLSEDHPVMKAGRAVLDKLQKYRGHDIKRRVVVNEPEFNPGHMYEAHIKANPDHFLDWDKPLSEQHPNVKKAVKALPNLEVPDWVKGGDVHEYIGNHMPGYINTDLETAAHLKKFGVPGIKYLDAGSRGKGDGTRNYVVFDDKLINVKRKYERGGDVSKALALTSKAIKYG